MLARLSGFWNSWRQYQDYLKLPKAQREFVVYSEGAHDWPHLGPMLLDLLATSHIPITYMSSDPKDPGLQVTSSRWNAFQIGSGAVRALFFRTLDARLCLMSLPDIQVYELKKSPFPVQYVYAFHSINSTHTAYREHAFEHYDVMLCVGPHHVAELRFEEKLKNLKARRLLEHGSVKLDTLTRSNRATAASPTSAEPFILLAPSWGSESSFGENKDVLYSLINQICSRNWRCSLRLHPMTTRRDPALIAAVRNEFSNYVSNSLLQIETDLNDNSSLDKAHVMVTDWSGAGTEFAFALGKPVLFVDMPQKINNPRASEFPMRGLEDFIREDIGDVVRLDELDRASSKLESLLNHPDVFVRKIQAAKEKWIFNLGKSSQVGSRHLAALFNEVSSAPETTTYQAAST